MKQFWAMVYYWTLRFYSYISGTTQAFPGFYEINDPIKPINYRTKKLGVSKRIIYSKPRQAEVATTLNLLLMMLGFFYGIRFLIFQFFSWFPVTPYWFEIIYLLVPIGIHFALLKSKLNFFKKVPEMNSGRIKLWIFITIMSHLGSLILFWGSLIGLAIQNQS